MDCHNGDTRLLIVVFFLAGLIGAADADGATSPGGPAGNSRGGMLTLENVEGRHFVIRRDDSMYEEFPELCLLPSGKLLCVYKVGPKHGPGGLVVLLESDDRGRTWKTLHEFSINCNMPRLQRISDGRLWLDTDSGGKVFVSEDDGQTWKKHDIGFGEHGNDRIIELSDGSWINSTCEPTNSGWHFRGRPYRIVQYRSSDKGQTWKRDAIIADVPGFNLTEATTVLLPDDTLVSYIRESSGLAHGCVRAVSTDNGRTWTVDRAPFNFAMPRAGLLQDGRMLVVGRNFAGNKSLYAWCDRPLATEGFKTQSMWAPDDSAVLTNEGLRIRCTDAAPNGAAARRMITSRQGVTKHGPEWEGLTTSGIEPPVYILPAPRRRDSKVTIDARLRVLSNETGLACVVNITEAQEVLFRPDRVEIFGQSDKIFRLDGTQFHDYRVVRDASSLTVYVDGEERIHTTKLARSRGVGYGVDTTHFGTSYRGFSHPFDSQDHFRRRKVVGKGESVWRWVKIFIENPGAANDSWSWDAADGTYPDQYQRDRMVEVKFQPLPNGQGGPSWVQFPDNEILVVHNGAMAEDAPKPFLMGCYLKPSDFPPAGGIALATRREADEILQLSGAAGGVIAHVGCNDGRLTAALGRDQRFVVHGLEADPAKIEKARCLIRSLGLYGRVSVEQRSSGRLLPYAENLINLLVAGSSGAVKLDNEEILRVLVPGGSACIRLNGRWQLIRKPRSANIDEWTHFLHGANGNAVSHDRRVAPPQRLQWQADPLWARSHEHLPSVSAMVSAGGRVFYIVEDGPRGSVPLPARWSLVARDAFNGTVLWRRHIEHWAPHLTFFSAFPFQLVRHLVVVGDTVFVTLGIDAPVSALDAATGATRLTYAGTEATEEIICADGKLIALVNPAGKIEAYLPHVADGRFKLDKRLKAAGKGASVYFPFGPGKNPRRLIVALDAKSSRTAWKKAAGNIFPRTVAAEAGRVFYQEGTEIVCLDLANGQELWRTAKLARPIPDKPWMVSATLVAWRDVVLYSNAYPDGKLVLTALSIKDGNIRWAAEDELSGHRDAVFPHHHVVDLMVADGLVWTCLPRFRDFQTGFRVGRDPATGEIKRRLDIRWDPDQINMGHHRCYRNKATDRYILTGLDGIEFLDLTSGQMRVHNYVRGTCHYGVMPANGLTYAPPHSCACNLHIRLKGLVALAGGPDDEAKSVRKEDPLTEGLQRGPAYEEPADTKPAVRKEQSDSWPTYRHDPARSGFTPATGPVEPISAWQVKLGGRLTAPTIAGGKVYLAEVDTYTMHALDATMGRSAWRFTVGAPVDSPPTFHDGRVIFGSADGWVYCLRAADGVLVWRFQAAPHKRWIGAWGRLESAWPVHGSVVMCRDEDAPSGASVYVAAGRSPFLDGGIRVYRLDAGGGMKLAEAEVCEPREWRSGKALLNACGSNDVLSFSGGKVYMRHLAFEADRLTHIEPDAHLISTIGFLDDSWWHRSYWLVSKGFTEGWGGWPSAGNAAPSGRILVLDNECVYGFGRNFYPRGSTAQWALGEKNVLFAALRRPEKRGGQSGKGNGVRFRVPCRWLRPSNLTVRAMALAGKTLFLAGPPSIDDRSSNANEVFEGKKGGLLQAVDAANGRTLAELKLQAGPVFDGLAVAGGKLYLALVDGTVACFAGNNPPDLASRSHAALTAKKHAGHHIDRKLRMAACRSRVNSSL